MNSRPTTEEQAMIALRPSIDIPIATTHLCDFWIKFSRHELEHTPLGLRFTVIVEDGWVRGDGLNGKFLPGGGDWITVGADGVARLDVRASLQTDDGAIVMVTNTGRARLDADVMDRFIKGDLIPAADMYARSSPLFETGDERYAWLNATHTVAVNQFSLHEVHYRVHQVL
jgi:hypothetical protein